MSRHNSIEPLEARIAPAAFGAVVELSSLDGLNGFKLSGVAALDYAGHSVSDAGDINGDGFDDLIIGANGADPNGSASGASYVVFGKANGFAANLELSALDGSNGFKINGMAEVDYLGSSVSGAGDVNDDGFDDLIVGAQLADPNGLNSGASYVVFGQAGGFAPTLDLPTLNGASGFKINGEAERDLLGTSVSGAGDVNGDGFADLIVGAPSSGTGAGPGASYVLFGKAGGFAPTLSLSTLDGATGFKISGNFGRDYSGSSVSGAGDVNGDGFDDVIIGASGANQGAGAAYVVFGKASGFGATLNVSTLDGANGFRMTGEAAGDLLRSVSGAGDVNGDGFDDLIAGAFAADPNGLSSGASYVIFGKANDFAASLALSTLDGANGFKINGEAADDLSGTSVSGAGDVNADGYGDLLIGASRTDFNGLSSGASYVVYGKAGDFGATLNLSTLDGLNGFRINGVAAFDNSGNSISRAGDVNGDRIDDLFIGARGADPNGNQSGVSYVLFGRGPAALPAISVGDVTAAEGNAGATSFSFPVTLSSASTQTVTVQFSTRDGTAIAGSDYTAIVNQTVQFAPGETTKIVVVTVNSDTQLEPDETFSAILANPTNATLADAEGSGLIVNDDSANAAVFELSSLDGLNGFKVSGLAERDFFGRVSDAGDINGDRFGDVIIGAVGADPNGLYNSGASYVVFGSSGGFPAELDLGQIDGRNGFKLSGGAVLDYSGSAVSAAGDVNGDGFGDLIIGAEKAGPNGYGSGASYVVFGKGTEFAANVDLSALNGRDGFKVSGRAEYDYSGHSVSGAGDINGDGFDDVTIGAWFADGKGALAGVSYVIFGRASGFAPNLNVAELDGTNGFEVGGEAGFDLSGSSVSGAGDINGDGFDDLVIGAPGAEPNGQGSGAGYLVFGKGTAFAAYFDLAMLDGTNGFKLSGGAEGDGAGRSVSAAGDLNGDGFADLIIGAPSADPNGPDSGESYVVFGSAGLFAPNLNLSELDGSNGFKLSGTAADDRSGASVSAAGDINGDGFGDLIIGGPGADPNGADSGASYVLLGKASGFAANLNVSELDGSNGFTINGEAAGDRAGQWGSAAGDFNGDGFGDLIIGAWTADPNGDLSGASYVIFGDGPPFISIGDAAAIEGDGGTSRFSFAVTLSFASTETVTVQFSTIDGAATAGSDYVALISQTLEFPPGETTRTVDVTVNGDTAIEPDESFFVQLSDPTNANFRDARAVGSILSDDHVQVVITQSGNRATFTDADGDLVTVKTTRGVFTQESFVFEYGQLKVIDLGGSGVGAFRGAKIVASATAAGGGDGLVNVSAFQSLGVNLKAVKIDGAVGEIDIGAGLRGEMALESFQADSLGLGTSAAESTFAGTVGVLKITRDVTGVLKVPGGIPEGESVASDLIKKVVVGGNLDGSAGGSAAGLLSASGGIGRVVIKGNVIGGAEQSGIIVGGKLGSVKIGGDLRSADPAHPVTISALGDLAGTKPKQAVAIGKLIVNGSVSDAEVLAGYRRDGTPFNPDASIGSIEVTGSWSASNVAAGVADVTGDGFGRNDALIAGDITPGLFARIASVMINGTATGSDRATSDYFGITAQHIGRVVAGVARPVFTAGPDEILIDAGNGDFRVVDFA